MRLFAVILCFLVCASFGAQMTDAQIKEQKQALKKLEGDLAKKRRELAMLENEEKGVLNTISLLDQNLNQTRTYIVELSKNEALVQDAVSKLSADIKALDKKIEERKYIPENLDGIKLNDYHDVTKQDFRGMAKVIWAKFFPDYGDALIDELVERSYKNKFSAY